MTTYAICRDYHPCKSFPILVGEKKIRFELCTDTKYECWMPDQIENDEFNLVILLDGLPCLVRSCHFDFVEG